MGIFSVHMLCVCVCCVCVCVCDVCVMVSSHDMHIEYVNNTIILIIKVFLLIVGIVHAYSTSVSEQTFVINFGEVHYCLFCYLFLVVSNSLVLLFANCRYETFAINYQ